MSDQRNHQKQQGAGDQQKSAQQQQRQRPNQKLGQAGDEQHDQQKQKGGQGDQQHAHSPDQISFYDESLKKQIEGSFKSDGNYIHVYSVYGTKSFPYSDLGACIDYGAQVSFVRKMLAELARDPGSGKFKDLSQQRDEQRQTESFSVWGQGAVGTNP
jgi:hypothetical protein